MTPSNVHVKKIKSWLMVHWTEWCWVMPGNGEAIFELLKALKKDGVIRSLEYSHPGVYVALREARKENQKLTETL